MTTGFIKDRDIVDVDASKVLGLLERPIVSPWATRRYVQSTHTYASDSIGNPGQRKDRPLATIARAVALSAGGDAIIVGPGHSETLSADLTQALNDLAIIGIGQGNRRPTIDMAATGNAVLLTGSGCTLCNLRLTSSVASLANHLIVSGDDNLLAHCKFEDTGAFTTLISVLCQDNADRIQVIGCEWKQPNAGPTAALRFIGTEEIAIIDCQSVGDYSVANLSNITTAATNARIEHVYMNNANAVDVNVDLVGTATGHIRDFLGRVATDAQTTSIDVFDGELLDAFQVNDDGERGLVIGTASA